MIHFTDAYNIGHQAASMSWHIKAWIGIDLVTVMWYLNLFSRNKIFVFSFILKLILFLGFDIYKFLAATKQLYEWFSPSVRPSVRLSVRLSVCLSHLFDYVPIIVSSWNFQELLPVTKVTSMQKVKVRGQRSRSQRSQPNLTVSGL